MNKVLSVLVQAIVGALLAVGTATVFAIAFVEIFRH